MTETVPNNTAIIESGHSLVLDAIMDSESLLYSAPGDYVWNVTVSTIFDPPFSTDNITAWTNYSTYGVPDNSGFEVTLTNSSGTFDITNQTVQNASAGMLDFPALQYDGLDPGDLHHQRQRRYTA